MGSAAYSLEQYVEDLRAITAAETDNVKITEQVRPLAAKLAATPGFMKDEFYRCNEEQGFSLHLLHEEDNHDLAVFVASWLPNRGTLAHNHKTWAVVVGMHGQEQETEWRRLDDGSKAGYAELQQTGQRVMTTGAVSTCMPDDIHTVWNVGEDVAISLHTYGRHINYTGRSEFDPEANVERPLTLIID